eukprot:gene23388-biopygen10333
MCSRPWGPGAWGLQWGWGAAGLPKYHLTGHKNRKKMTSHIWQEHTPIFPTPPGFCSLARNQLLTVSLVPGAAPLGCLCGLGGPGAVTLACQESPYWTQKNEKVTSRIWQADTPIFPTPSPPGESRCFLPWAGRVCMFACLWTSATRSVACAPPSAPLDGRRCVTTGQSSRPRPPTRTPLRRGCATGQRGGELRRGSRKTAGGLPPAPPNEKRSTRNGGLPAPRMPPPCTDASGLCNFAATKMDDGQRLHLQQSNAVGGMGQKYNMTVGIAKKWPATVLDGFTPAHTSTGSPQHGLTMGSPHIDVLYQ